MTRIAIIGAGVWGQNHIRVIGAERSCTLAAIVDPDRRALEAAATRVPGARLTSDVDDILGDTTIDAVVIASPAVTHTPLALAALDRGKHVLVEKPAAMRLVDAIRLAEAVEARRLVGMVGHVMVHHPAVVRLREILDSGSLGSLRYIHGTRVNLGRIRQDENALWSFGPHDLSMIDFLSQKQPHSVAAHGQCVLQPGVEDVVFLMLRYATGEMAHVHLSWLNPHKERRLTLVCSQKMVEFDDVSRDKLRIYDKGYDRPPAFTEYSQFLTLRDGDVHIPQISMEEPLALQLRHFIDCIRTGASPVADFRSAVRITAVLEAAGQSLAREGRPVKIAAIDNYL